MKRAKRIRTFWDQDQEIVCIGFLSEDWELILEGFREATFSEEETDIQNDIIADIDDILFGDPDKPQRQFHGKKEKIK